MRNATCPVIYRRTFDSYEVYVALQGQKAMERRDQLLAELPESIKSFEKIFHTVKPRLNPGAVLCLGARTGAESIAASRVGFVGSVGIDLHPVGPTVMRADWHALPFSDNSFPNAYSNSLDHCLILERLAGEIRRVLIPDGRFYLMATNRNLTPACWFEAGGNEALYWRTSNDLCDAVVAYGFDLMKTWRVGKWGHYVLRNYRS